MTESEIRAAIDAKREDDRKGTPLYSGVNRYFPAALAGVARVSLAGSRQHHGSDELFDDRTKSVDDADALLRHLHDSEIGDGMDGDVPHIDKVAWRALRLSQKWHERHAAPRAPAALNGGPLVGNPIPPNYDPDNVAFRPGDMDSLRVECSGGDDRKTYIGDQPPSESDAPEVEDSPQPDPSQALSEMADWWGRVVRGDVEYRVANSTSVSGPDAQVIAHSEGACDYGDPIAPRGTP